MKYLILTLLCVSVVLHLFTPSSEERQIEKDNKYKNGPVVIGTNNIGCTKYDYYDSIYWKCKDPNINYVEEQVCTPQAGRADNCHAVSFKVLQ